MSASSNSGPDKAPPYDLDGWYRFTEHASIPMAAVDGPEHIIRYTNPAFCQLVGKRAEDLVGHPFSATVPTGDGCLLILDRIYRTGEAAIYADEERSPGSLHWSLAMWSILAVDQEPVGIMIQVTETTTFFRQASREISEALMLSSVRQHEFAEAAADLNLLLKEELAGRRDTEDALRKSSAILENLIRERTKELDRVIGEMEGFTYAVAHDLRGPIRGIVSTAHILLQEAQEHLEEIHVESLNRQAMNAIKLAKLIDDLLHLSRLSRHPITMEFVDLQAMANDWAIRLPHAYPDRKIRIAVEDNLATHGDALTLRALMQNLLDNAAKFSPDGGLITVGRRIVDGKPAFYVKDEGVGFDMAHSGRLFKPFERLVGEQDFPGNGIGLAIVKSIAMRHGGRVWAESEIGQGATFYFRLSDDGSTG